MSQPASALPAKVRHRLIASALAVAALLTALLGASLFWTHREQERQMLDLAETEAKTQLTKDLAFRAWATQLGGLYVPVTPQTPPNPFMAMIEERDVTTPSGKMLTLYNPAILVRMLTESQASRYGINTRITGEQVLNPINRPDPWESKALAIVKQTLRDYSEVTELDGVPVLRRMQPMIMEPGCLKCHAWTGIKVGELRGATDVAIPLAPYRKLRDETQSLILKTHGGLWLGGLAFIGLVTRRRLGILGEKHVQDEVLRKLNRAIDQSASGIMITDADGLIEYVNNRLVQICGYERADLIGNNPRVLKSGETGAEVYAAMWRKLRAGEDWRGEIKNRRKTGEVFWSMVSISPMVNDAREITHFVAVMEDINERKFAESTIERLAFFDPLTDLPNRRLLMQRLQSGMTRSRRTGKPMALLYLDLDRFKIINDTLGHSAGDQVLKEAALRLRHALRDSDMLARMGGDEFAILIEDIDTPDDVSTVVNRVLTGMDAAFMLNSREMYVTASIGISLFPADADNLELLVSRADASMYLAKQAGKNTYRFYEDRINSTAIERMHLETGLRNALRASQFFVEYQPKLALATGRIYGMEALVRWQHPERGLIGPDHFIKLAEEIGEIDGIGEWVLRAACGWTRHWLQAGHDLVVSVNISPIQLRAGDLHLKVAAILEETGLPPAALELEITESALMDDPQKCGEILGALRALGVSLSIDDFGTGYSSLSHLKLFPVSTLKIDRSFVRDIVDDENDLAIATAVIALARSMKLQVLAEGVETVEQRDLLQALGCDSIQGFWLSRPLSAEGFSDLLQRQDRESGL